MKTRCYIFVVLFLVCAMLVASNVKVAYAGFENNISYKSAVLIDKNSGKVLFEQNSNEKVHIASVTKLMTILLTLEEIENNRLNLTDIVTVSENASGMGGSQVFLEANGEYKVAELLKSVIVASANDSSVALAEHIAGSETNFVRMMNQKANELNLVGTYYANCTGLPTPDGVSTAFDQAVVLSKVLNYEVYHKFSSIWLEDFVHPSGRTTQMANTNKLSRFYSGCVGGKTGSTNQAKYCLAVGAKRDKTELIAVVLGVENSKDRFQLASSLLNYGFENFTTTEIFNQESLKDVKIEVKGNNRQATLKAEKNYSVVHKVGEKVNYSINLNLPNKLTSVKENQIVGNAEIVIDGVVVERINILSCNTIDEFSVWDYVKEIVKN